MGSKLRFGAGFNAGDQIPFTTNYNRPIKEIDAELKALRDEWDRDLR